MRSPPGYAARPVHEIEQEGAYRVRLAEARLEREARMAAAMATSAPAIRAYRRERDKRIEQGRPVLPTLNEWRGGR